MREVPEGRRERLPLSQPDRLTAPLTRGALGAVSASKENLKLTNIYKKAFSEGSLFTFAFLFILHNFYLKQDAFLVDIYLIDNIMKTERKWFHHEKNSDAFASEFFY